MRTLLFIFLVVFSTASLAHKHRHCHYGHGHGHHHHHAHYGYGYTNFFFVPGNVYERDVYRVRGGYVVEETIQQFVIGPIVLESITTTIAQLTTAIGGGKSI